MECTAQCRHEYETIMKFCVVAMMKKCCAQNSNVKKFVRISSLHFAGCMLNETGSQFVLTELTANSQQRFQLPVGMWLSEVRAVPSLPTVQWTPYYGHLGTVTLIEASLR